MVTPAQVSAAFAAVAVKTSVAEANTELGVQLAPLFNDGGGPGAGVGQVVPVLPIVASPAEGTGVVTISHAASGVVAGVYGDGSHIPVATIDSFGHVTSISVVPVIGSTPGSALPSALGVAAAGVASAFSREDHVHPLPTASQVGAEPALGNPSANGQVLSSTVAGVRSWIDRFPASATVAGQIVVGDGAGGITSYGGLTIYHSGSNVQDLRIGGTTVGYISTYSTGTYVGGFQMYLDGALQYRLISDIDGFHLEAANIDVPLNIAPGASGAVTIAESGSRPVVVGGIGSGFVRSSGGTLSASALLASEIPTLNQNTTGSAAKWTTPRTLTIGATGKALDGSANVSWSLADIGAAAASSLASYLPLSGGTMNTGAQIATNKDITPSASNNMNYIACPLVVNRVSSSNTDYTNVAAIGFHNRGVNAAALYYEATAGTPSFKYNRDYGGIVTIFDNVNLTNLNQLANGPGYVTNATVANVDVTEHSSNNVNYPVVWDNGARSLYHTAAKMWFNPYSGLFAATAIASGSTLSWGGGILRDYNSDIGALYGSSVPSPGTQNHSLAWMKNGTSAALNGSIQVSLQINGADRAIATSSGLAVTGNLSATGALTWGGAATIPSSDYVVQGNGAGPYGHRTAEVSSFNTLLPSGFYDNRNGIFPLTTGWTHMIRSAHSDPSSGSATWSFDLAANFYTPANGHQEGYYVRVNEGSSWGTWRTLWHSGNLSASTLPGGPYLPLAGGVLTAGAVLTLTGIESNNIANVHNSSAITTNAPVSIASIRQALSFRWYDTDWQIGNIRGGATDTQGFGITAGNNNLRWRCTNGATYDYNSLYVGGQLSVGGMVAKVYSDTNYYSLWGDAASAPNYSFAASRNGAETYVGASTKVSLALAGFEKFKVFSGYNESTVPLYMPNLSIWGTARPGDGGRWMHYMGGDAGGVSTGTSTALIDRYQYSGFSGFVVGNTEFYGQTISHSGAPAQYSIVAGRAGAVLSFHVGEPTLVGSNYRAPKVGDWTTTSLSVYQPINSMTVAQMSAWSGSPSVFARFGHSAWNAGSGFGYIQANTGAIYLEAPAGQTIHQRIDGTTRLQVKDTGIVVSGGISANAALVGGMKQVASRFWTTSSVLPVMGVNEWCFLVCDFTGPANVMWTTNSTQTVVIRSGGSTYTTAINSTLTDGGSGFYANYRTMILVGPTVAGNSQCSVIVW